LSSICIVSGNLASASIEWDLQDSLEILPKLDWAQEYLPEALKVPADH